MEKGVRTKLWRPPTDSEAQLYHQGKGKRANLCVRVHVLMENRHCQIISPNLSWRPVVPHGKRKEGMVGDFPGRHRIIVESDKTHDTWEFVQYLHANNTLPHAAQNRNGRFSAN